jgi:hypothetical protein
MKDMDHPDYQRLAAVLRAAYDQASRGKGKERHASDGLEFENQPMSAINRQLGSIDGFLYQAAKKAQEARRLPYGRAQAELLGAINYLAGAIIALDTWAQGTLPESPADIVTSHPPADADFWIDWHGGDCPVPGHVEVECILRAPMGLLRDRADKINWSHTGHLAPTEVVRYRIARHG